MKILVIAQDFPPKMGGVAMFLHNICLQLCSLGHRVDVLTCACDNCVEVDTKQPYRIYRYVSARRLSSLAPLLRVLSLNYHYQYNITFIGHSMNTHALGVLAQSKLRGVPYVILSHGNDLDYSAITWVDKTVSQRLLHNASLMLANSRFTATRIQNTGYRGKIEILTPGVDTENFNPNVNTSEIKEKYHLNGRRIILTVARLVEHKNIKGVLKALIKVIENVPDALYLIIGDGDKKEELEHLTNKLELNNHVRFVGKIDNNLLPQFYCACDLYMMPSLVETFGISYIEASACGKSVIGGCCGGVADAVIDGETGILVDPHKTDEIADAIILLLTNRKLAQRLGENGRRRVEQELSWKKVGERLGCYLRSVITSRVENE